MRAGSTNPSYGGASQKSGLKAGPNKPGKSRAAVSGGGPADYIGGPQPVPAPQAMPGPVPAPQPQRPPHPHPAAATGGRVPQGAGPYGGTAGPQSMGMPYQPPGNAQHDLLALLLQALRPDEF